MRGFLREVGPSASCASAGAAESSDEPTGAGVRRQRGAPVPRPASAASCACCASRSGCGPRWSSSCCRSPASCSAAGSGGGTRARSRWRQQIDRNYDAAPVDARRPCCPIPTRPCPQGTSGGPVRVRGTYLADRGVARAQPPARTGCTATRSSCPFRPATAGPCCWWTAAGSRTAPRAPVPTPSRRRPSGEVSVVARLRPTEPPDDRVAPAGSGADASTSPGSPADRRPRRAGRDPRLRGARDRGAPAPAAAPRLLAAARRRPRAPPGLRRPVVGWGRWSSTSCSSCTPARRPRRACRRRGRRRAVAAAVPRPPGRVAGLAGALRPPRAHRRGVGGPRRCGRPGGRRRPAVVRGGPVVDDHEAGARHASATSTSEAAGRTVSVVPTARSRSASAAAATARGEHGRGRAAARTRPSRSYRSAAAAGRAGRPRPRPTRSQDVLASGRSSRSRGTRPGGCCRAAPAPAPGRCRPAGAARRCSA